MPATAGRIRMPANNRVSVSDSLKLSEIWQKSVGYDPYAPDDPSTDPLQRKQAPADERSKGLGALTMLGGNRELSTPGACKKCHQVGHLTYQCRNTPVAADTRSEPRSNHQGGDLHSLTSNLRIGEDDEPGLAPRGSCATDTSVLFTSGRNQADAQGRTSSKRRSLTHEDGGSSPRTRRKTLKCPRGHRHRLKKRYFALLNNPNLDEDLRKVLQRAANKR